jgi:hypothetical protein
MSKPEMKHGQPARFLPGFLEKDGKTTPIGSMYAIYGNIYHQHTPNVSIYIPYMDPMGHGLKEKYVVLPSFTSFSPRRGSDRIWVILGQDLRPHDSVPPGGHQQDECCCCHCHRYLARCSTSQNMDRICTSLIHM